MEREMKEAEAELKRRKVEEEEGKERERKKVGDIATPGRFEKKTGGKGGGGSTPGSRRTPFRVGL